MTTGGGAWEGILPAGLLPPPPLQTGIRALAEHGLLTSAILAAHCVHVDADEIELLARHDVAVAHCPRSNAYLGCGVAPLEQLRAAGIRVGIATDSPASTPSFDMFAEMRAAIEAARARARRPDALGAAEALELATLGGARALGLDSEIGSLGVGKRADLAIISLAETSFVPWEDPATAVVLGGSPQHVVETLVEGLRTSEKGIEWHALIERAQRARSRMLA
jgi:5-methylthioadenosine/S-adenosylhomocysteine deaminase